MKKYKVAVLCGVQFLGLAGLIVSTLHDHVGLGFVWVGFLIFNFITIFEYFRVFESKKRAVNCKKCGQFTTCTKNAIPTCNNCGGS